MSYREYHLIAKRQETLAVSRNCGRFFGRHLAAKSDDDGTKDLQQNPAYTRNRA